MATIYISFTALFRVVNKRTRVQAIGVTISSTVASARTTTEAGHRLLAHYRQVSQLESAVMADLLPDAPQKTLTVIIVTNADSLATWLIPLAARKGHSQGFIPPHHRICSANAAPY